MEKKRKYRPLICLRASLWGRSGWRYQDCNVAYRCSRASARIGKAAYQIQWQRMDRRRGDDGYGKSIDRYRENMAVRRSGRRTGASFGLLLSLIAHVFIGGKEFTMPIDIDAGPRLIRRSFNKELAAGRIERVHLTLERGYGTYAASVTRYQGPIFGDVGCMDDYVKAQKMGGVAGRL
jgi:hypothetical protein